MFDSRVSKKSGKVTNYGEFGRCTCRDIEPRYRYAMGAPYGLTEWTGSRNAGALTNSANSVILLTYSQWKDTIWTMI